ncbi:2-dehydro-3-deoxygalactonokinase [Stakelama tenebrarum]|uniref:2-dehydro-3-deoxygalactonokinase n=1 Tax=Stakelama tenebrarum TaxID=2711215 RepID=A0A6G6Y5U9_9SPHN|nr:2-dehydro-3-deoxygalactonokinase [Sphingosinithalassobacter tenebrarum]QIG80221.1 2-dehydro-3-deoxygalactonokinase [Sphingosinithalassobacter tenebrarum]
MPEKGAYIAIDWGTTNRRVHLVAASGRALRSERDDRGVLAMEPTDYPAAIADVRERFGTLPILAAGMIGSNRGWVDVPYVDLPTGFAALAEAVVCPEESVFLIPGVARRQRDRADVMRGEEVQVLGAIAADMAPGDGHFCQPGTHNKWVVTDAGRIVDFATTMTGELFALLKAQGTLAGMLNAPVCDGPAFREGLARGTTCRDLSAQLFGVRAGVLLETIAPEDAASYASGVLIGADVRAQSDSSAGRIHLIAQGTLATLYAAAFAAAGMRVVAIDSDAAFLAGVHGIWEKLQ